MSCGVGCRHGLDPALLWLWLWLLVTAPIWPPAWEPPYALCVAIKRPKKKKVYIKNNHQTVHKIVCPTTRFFSIIIFFSFYGCNCHLWRFPGQESNWSCSCRPVPQPPKCQIWVTSVTYAAVCSNAGARPGIKSHSQRHNVGFLNCWAISETPIILYLLYR